MNTLTSLEKINSLLLSGRRPIRLYRHSLWVWGVGIGLLCLFLDPLMRSLNIQSIPLYATTVLSIMLIAFIVMAVLDWRVSQSLRSEEGMVLPFVQQQIQKIWCVLMVAGWLLTLGMMFFGGGHYVYGAWLVIVGLGLFIHGLFSEQLPEWIGGALILLGVVPFTAHATHQFTRWLAIAAFGVGLPLLAHMLDGGIIRILRHRFLQLILWLFVVIMIAVAGNHFSQPTFAKDLVSYPYHPQQSYQCTCLIEIPAEQTFDLKIHLEADVIGTTAQANSLTLRTRYPIQLYMKYGKLTPWWRRSGSEQWQRAGFSLKRVDITGQLNNGEGIPELDTALNISLEKM